MFVVYALDAHADFVPPAQQSASKDLVFGQCFSPLKHGLRSRPFSARLWLISFTPSQQVGSIIEINHQS